MGTTLTPLGPNASWPSPSGHFAFGFRPVDPTNSSSPFLLAIWFAKTATPTIVWSANGKLPVPSGSQLLLTSDGQLSLRDPTGHEVWNPGGLAASHASILDSGNLVLAGADSSIKWQSFASPTDTILPSQILPLGTQLLSHLTATDYSDGRFLVAVQADGNLVFYPVSVSGGLHYDPYWASNTVGSGSQLVFDESGFIYFALKNGTRINLNLNSTTTLSTRDFYQRATLDPDGVFRQYVYPKNGLASGWTDAWNPTGKIPDDICRVLVTQIGSGACGFNSYCVIDDNQMPDCRCPTRYSFIDPTRKYKGCKPDFAPQSCDAGDEARFEFVVVADVNWPQGDYEHLTQMDENQCRDNCLRDCFCGVAIFNSGSCWKKRLPLSNGMMGSYIDHRGLIKVPKANNTNNNQFQPQPSKKNDQKTLILTGSVLLGSSVFLNLLLIPAIFILVLCFNRMRNQKVGVCSSTAGLNLRAFTYKELEGATKNFSDELGSGAFGIVYKGVLVQGSETFIAVKKLDKLLKETENEFSNEVRSIGQTHHKNLVKLLGFCNEETQRLLVYEYMSNGSLRGFLSMRPDWSQRVRIALGIARGLVYLHDECSSQIIHCDIKPQNILLDDNFNARISDFGLAKLLRADQTRTNTGIKGTKGYVAPEWFKSVAITAKVDVYSFGVVLLEIVTCRRCLELETGKEEEAVLTYWACDCYREGRVDLLVMGDEEAMGDVGRLERVVKVALWCIQEDPLLRPSMQKVIQMLEGAAQVPEPPDPSTSWN